MTPSLSSITILAPADQTGEEALTEWAKGSEWIAWLLKEIPVKLPALSADPPPAGHHALVLSEWDRFIETQFQAVLAPLLSRGWAAAEGGRTKELQALAGQLHSQLPVASCDHSQHAAELLLQTTRSATHQGVLGKHRAAISDNLCPAHLLIIWTLIGSLFHLGLAVICTEFLRLEWRMLARHHLGMEEPVGQHSIAGLTQQFLNGHLPQGFSAGPGID